MAPLQTPRIRVLLVDDHPISSWGLERLLLSAHSQVELVGTASDGNEATRFIYETPINVIVVNLDGELRVDLIAELCSISPARVVALTGSRDVSLHDGAILAGARGMVVKSEPVESLISAIEKVDEGEFWIDRAATTRIFLHLAQNKVPHFTTPENQKIDTLTRRERETALEITKDAAANGKILAQRLGISENTLRNHLNSIYGKLGLSSRLELFAYAKLHLIPGKA